MKSTMPIGALTAAARDGLAGNWGKSIAVALVCMILIVGVSVIPWAGKILQLIFDAPLVVGLHCYFLATVRRQPNLFSLLFTGFDRFGTAWCAYMLVFLIVMAWMIPFGILTALIVPLVHLDTAVLSSCTTMLALAAIVILIACSILIFMQMRYYLVLYIVADDPTVRARGAIRRSVQLMKGNYWRLGLLWLRFTGWILLGILTLGVGFIWLGPYYMASITAFYDDLATNG